MLKPESNLFENQEFTNDDQEFTHNESYRVKAVVNRKKYSSLGKILRFSRALGHLDASPRLLISIAISGLVCLLLPYKMHLPTRAIICWDVGTICYLTLAWNVIASATPGRIRRWAQRHDSSSWVLFALAIGASFASLIAVCFILATAKNQPPIMMVLHVVLSVLSVVCSWFLVHTLFALRYAHCYYGDIDPSPRYLKAGGFNFPEEENPDYWEFAYYSFTVGMTFQVSDVSITAHDLRRLTMLHALLSFAFYTVILGLSMSLISNLFSS